MKKYIYLLVFSLILSLGSCIKGYNFNDNNNEAVRENVQNIFGVVFDKNHTWSTTTNGTVFIKADAPLDNIEKVQLLVYSKIVDDEDNIILKVLNEASCTNNDIVELNFDMPNDYEGLYVACISKNGGYYLKEFKIEDKNISFQNTNKTRGITRSDLDISSLPSNPTLGRSEISYETQRKYSGFENEKLWQLNDEDEPLQIINVDNYNDDLTSTLKAVVFTYLPNGRKYNNLPQIKESGVYNENSYLITTGNKPIMVSPIYKNDGGYHEVETCDLYYYYFKESDIVGDPVSYFKSLPKYKAIQLNRSIKGDNVLEKHHSYCLIYWGNNPEIGTVGSYQFPPEYKIGFMIRSKYKDNVKKGELYFDGRLNNDINKHGHFASSKLGDGDPRMCWMSVNKKLILCCEAGTDADFNDILFEVEGGVQQLEVAIEPEYNFYTFLFEDREIGDYDMNDIVIQAQRIDNVHVKYYIVACGAQDALYIKNINGQVINENKEIHEYFGVGQHDFVNVYNKTYEPISEIITVDSKFSFLNENDQIYIYNKTVNKLIKISKKGEDPHGIIVPYDFKWAKERVCIKNAYLMFNNWGANPITSTDWYKYPNEENIVN